MMCVFLCVLVCVVCAALCDIVWFVFVYLLCVDVSVRSIICLCVGCALSSVVMCECCFAYVAGVRAVFVYASVCFVCDVWCGVIWLVCCVCGLCCVLSVLV